MNYARTSRSCICEALRERLWSDGRQLDNEVAVAGDDNLKRASGNGGRGRGLCDFHDGVKAELACEYVLMSVVDWGWRRRERRGRLL